MQDDPHPEQDLVRATLRFCRALRESGMAATPADAVDAARALAAVDLADRDELYLGLRAVLAGRIDDYPVFDEVFARFWSAVPERQGLAAAGASAARAGVPPEQPTAPRRGPSQPSLETWLRSGAAAAAEPMAAPLAGDRETAAEKDFATFDGRELDEITRLAARLARRLAVRPSRRWRPVPRGARIHPRRTARQAFRTGGEVVELSFRERRPKKAKLVLLCDVSGSMDLYARFLLQFVYALQNRFSRVESFVFSTHLSRITEALRGASYRRALDRLTGAAHGWSGGTRIGESLASFQRDWPRLVDRRTLVVVLSDGWDTGEPKLLAGALGAIRRRAGKLIWLNPLLGSPNYQPLTRGMQAALPHVDVFAPAHDLESLRSLVRHLSI